MPSTDDVRRYGAIIASGNLKSLLGISEESGRPLREVIGLGIDAWCSRIQNDPAFREEQIEQWMAAARYILPTDPAMERDRTCLN